jgi:organic radical activating enzyme
MKWLKPGHQFDEVAKLFERVENVYIYGAGIKGKIVLENLESLNVNVIFIDRVAGAYGSAYGKNVILPLETGKINKNNSVIVVAATPSNEHTIFQKLITEGWQESINCFSFERFLDFYLPIYACYRFDILIAPLYNAITLSFNEKCSLKCKNCNANIPYLEDRQVISFEQVKDDIKSLFSKIDFIHQLRIGGGEPLTYPYLLKVIEYLSENFHKNFNHLQFTTNGTIIPDDSVLETLSKYDVMVCVSDYTPAIPRLKSNYEIIEELFKKRNIHYELMENLVWADFGFNKNDGCASDESVLSLYDACYHPCKDFRNGSLMNCSQAYYASRRYHLPMEFLDFIDPAITKKEILEYIYGFCKGKGFLEACRYCNGHMNVNKSVIPAAEQII